MVFSSTFFLIYFLPVFFTIYFILPVGFKNYYIVFASILFYAWGAPQFVFVLVVSIILNFALAHLLVSVKEDNPRKNLLAFSVIINLSLLLYFKYANFFV